MSYRTVHEENIHLIGLKVTCPFDQFAIEIPKASLNLHRRRDTIKSLLNPDEQIGVHKEEPRPEEDAYFICYQVSSIQEVPEGMVGITVPARSYAAADYEGLPEECHATYAGLAKWISDLGLRKEPKAWTLEKRTPLLGSTVDEVREQFRMQIQIPLS